MSKHPSDMRPESRNNLFKQLGVLAQSVGWVRAGVPLGESISKMIRKLSNAEIASFENGAGIPHHVKAYAAKQAAEAKKVQQEADAARNDAQKNLTIPHGMDEAFGRGGVLRAHRGLPGSVRYGRQDIASSGSSGRNYASLSTQWDPSTGGVGLTRSNFFNTPFAGLGLDLNTTKSLFSQGFNAQQIKQAANDTRALGIDVNEDVAKVARLNRDAPQFMPKARKSKDNWDDYHRSEADLRKKETEAERLRQNGKTDEAAKLESEIAAQRKRLDEQKKAHEQHDKKAVDSVPSSRRDDARRVLENIRRNSERRNKLEGPDAEHRLNQEDRRADLRARNEEQAVEGQHRKKVAQIEAKPSATGSALDKLANIAQHRAKPSKQANDQARPSNSDSSQHKDQKTAAQAPDKQSAQSNKPDNRHARLTKAAKPTV